MKSPLSGNSLRAKSLRGAALTLTSVGGTNLLRLGSNLILTRILFPEAFGLMALVQVFVTGLKMFSDTGIRASIIQNKRGDDPDFLNTAWTLQIIRGVVLWLGTCALALPAAALYDAPLLAWLLPVVGIGTLISGFATTNVATQNRHLILGRLTVIELGTQALNILIIVGLAWWLRSVWALAIGAITGSILTVLAQHWLLPGIRNRLHWDRAAFGELFGFGKFIFLSTAVSFVVAQGDKAILGAYIPLAALGVYNIGYFLGSIPQLLNQAVMSKVVFPLYRMKPITESPENRAHIFRTRRIVIFCSVSFTMLMSYGGIALVEFLYDPRYAMAGPVVVLLNLVLVPGLVLKSYGAVFLSSGDSRQFFLLNATTAVVQTVLMFIGVIWFSIFGVLVAQGLAILITYPLRVRALRRHQAWDVVGDAALLSLGGMVNGLAVWWHWDAITQLM